MTTRDPIVRSITEATYEGQLAATLTAPGAACSVVMLRLEPYARITHAHPQAETLVPMGPIELTVCGVERVVDLEEAADVPAGAEHTLHNPRGVPVRVMSIACPGWDAVPPVTVAASVAEAADRLDINTEHDPLVTMRETQEHASEAEFSRARGDLNAAIDEMAIAAAYALHALALLTADKPAEDCDVCNAKAGEDCADPVACRDAREAIARAMFDAVFPPEEVPS